jgi:hypothetical protein
MHKAYARISMLVVLGVLAAIAAILGLFVGIGQLMMMMR